MAFGAENVQAADLNHLFMLAVGIGFVLVKTFVPLRHRTLEFRSVVIEDDGLRVILLQSYLAAGRA